MNCSKNCSCFLRRLKGPRCFLKNISGEVNWHNSMLTHDVTHMHVSVDAQRENKLQATHPNLIVNAATGRSDVSIRLRSMNLASSIPPSHLFSFLSLSFSHSHLKLSHKSPIFLPDLTSFFSFIIYHCLLSLPSELAPCTFPLHHSFPPLSLFLLLRLSVKFPLVSSPSPPCPLAQVLMKHNAPLIAPLLIYSEMERTGQLLKGWVNYRQVLLMAHWSNVCKHLTGTLCSKASKVNNRIWHQSIRMKDNIFPTI